MSHYTGHFLKFSLHHQPLTWVCQHLLMGSLRAHKHLTFRNFSLNLSPEYYLPSDSIRYRDDHFSLWTWPRIIRSDDPCDSGGRRRTTAGSIQRLAGRQPSNARTHELLDYNSICTLWSTLPADFYLWHCGGERQKTREPQKLSP